MVSFNVVETSAYGTCTYPDPEIDVFYDVWHPPHVTVTLYEDNLTTCNSEITFYNSTYVTVIGCRLASTIQITPEQDNANDYWDHIEELKQTKKGWQRKPMQKLPEPLIQRPLISRKLMLSMSGWVAKKGRIKRSGHL
jgi:hypothetical protein